MELAPAIRRATAAVAVGIGLTGASFNSGDARGGELDRAQPQPPATGMADPLQDAGIPNPMAKKIGYKDVEKKLSSSSLGSLRMISGHRFKPTDSTTEDYYETAQNLAKAGITVKVDSALDTTFRSAEVATIQHGNFWSQRITLSPEHSIVNQVVDAVTQRPVPAIVVSGLDPEVFRPLITKEIYQNIWDDLGGMPGSLKFVNQGKLIKVTPTDRPGIYEFGIGTNVEEVRLLPGSDPKVGKFNRAKVSEALTQLVALPTEPTVLTATTEAPRPITRISQPSTDPTTVTSVKTPSPEELFQKTQAYFAEKDLDFDGRKEDPIPVSVIMAMAENFVEDGLKPELMAPIFKLDLAYLMLPVEGLPKGIGGMQFAGAEEGSATYNMKVTELNGFIRITVPLIEGPATPEKIRQFLTTVVDLTSERYEDFSGPPKKIATSLNTSAGGGE